MSYILDALKKAAEQRGAMATGLLRPSPPHARRGWSRLPWIVAGLLVLLNLGGLIYFLWPASVPPAPPVATQEPAPARRVSLIQPVEPAPPPTQVITPEPRRPATGEPRPAPANTAAVKPATERPTPRPSPDVRTSATAPVVPPAPAVTRPETSSKLKLEVLSYSDNPAQRLVFINGRRYKEGDTIDGGAKVEEIREDGVVLSDQGQRFTLR